MESKTGERNKTVESSTLKEPPKLEPLAAVSFFFALPSYALFLFTVVVGLWIRSGRSSPYDEDAIWSWLFAMMIILPLWMVAGLLSFIAFVIGAFACRRIRSMKRKCSGLPWAISGMLPFGCIVFMFAYSSVVGGTSWHTRERKLERQLAEARQAGDSEEARNIEIQLGLGKIEDEIPLLTHRIGSHRHEKGRLPESLVPDLRPPISGMEIAADLPHDPFGEIVTVRYEWHGRAGGWIVYQPEMPPAAQYVTLDGDAVDTTTLLDNDEYYAPRNRAFYRYCRLGDRYLLASRGPDEDWDTTNAEMEAMLAGDWDALSAEMQYDPTNGILSNGDILMDFEYHDSGRDQ